VSELHKAREDLRSVNKERKEAAEMSTLEALLGDEQRRLVAEAAELFGQTQESLMQSLVSQIKSTAGFATASSDKQLAIVASRLTKLEEEVQRWRQESEFTNGGAVQCTANSQHWYLKGWRITTVNCHNMKMTEHNHNFTPKRIIFQKTMCAKKCVSAR
jgi:hypothetical protein